MGPLMGNVSPLLLEHGLGQWSIVLIAPLSLDIFVVKRMDPAAAIARSDGGNEICLRSRPWKHNGRRLRPVCGLGLNINVHIWHLYNLN